MSMTAPAVSFSFISVPLCLRESLWFSSNGKLSECRRKRKVEREEHAQIDAQRRAERRGGSSSPAPCSGNLTVNSSLPRPVVTGQEGLEATRVALAVREALDAGTRVVL